MRVEVVVVTSDRGLAGAFNASVLKHASRVIAGQEALGRRVTLQLVGRKAADFFRRRRPDQIGRASPFGEASYDKAREIAQGLIERYVAGEIDEAILVGSEFASAMTQTPHDLKIVPIAADGAPVAAPTDGAPFSAEPNLASLLDVLAPKVLEVTIYRALLEGFFGEAERRQKPFRACDLNAFIPSAGSHPVSTPSHTFGMLCTLADEGYLSLEEHPYTRQITFSLEEMPPADYVERRLAEPVASAART